MRMLLIKICVLVATTIASPTPSTYSSSVTITKSQYTCNNPKIIPKTWIVKKFNTQCATLAFQGPWHLQVSTPINAKGNTALHTGLFSTCYPCCDNRIIFWDTTPECLFDFNIDYIMLDSSFNLATQRIEKTRTLFKSAYGSTCPLAIFNVATPKYYQTPFTELEDLIDDDALNKHECTDEYERQYTVACIGADDEWNEYMVFVIVNKYDNLFCGNDKHIIWVLTRANKPSYSTYKKAIDDIIRSGLCPNYLISIDQSVNLSEVPTVTLDDIKGVVEKTTVTKSTTKSTTSCTDSDIDADFGHSSSTSTTTTVTTISTVEFTLNEDYTIPYDFDFYEHCGNVKILKNLQPETIREALSGTYYLYLATPCLFAEINDAKIGLMNTAFPACSLQIIFETTEGPWVHEKPIMMCDRGINAITGERSITRNIIGSAFDGNCPFGAFMIHTEGYYKDHVIPKVTAVTPEGIIMKSPGKLYTDSYMACIAGYQPDDFLLITIADKYKNLFFDDDDDVTPFYVLTRQRIVPQNVIETINQEICRCGYHSKYLVSIDQTFEITEEFIFEKSYFEYSHTCITESSTVEVLPNTPSDSVSRSIFPTIPSSSNSSPSPDPISCSPMPCFCPPPVPLTDPLYVSPIPVHPSPPTPCYNDPTPEPLLKSPPVPLTDPRYVSPIPVHPSPPTPCYNDPIPEPLLKSPPVPLTEPLYMSPIPPPTPTPCYNDLTPEPSPKPIYIAPVHLPSPAPVYISPIPLSSPAPFYIAPKPLPLPEPCYIPCKPKASLKSNYYIAPTPKPLTVSYKSVSKSLTTPQISHHSVPITIPSTPAPIPCTPKIVPSPPIDPKPVFPQLPHSSVQRSSHIQTSYTGISRIELPKICPVTWKIKTFDSLCATKLFQGAWNLQMATPMSSKSQYALRTGLFSNCYPCSNNRMILFDTTPQCPGDFNTDYYMIDSSFNLATQKIETTQSLLKSAYGNNLAIFSVITQKYYPTAITDLEALNDDQMIRHKCDDFYEREYVLTVIGCDDNWQEYVVMVVVNKYGNIYCGNDYHVIWVFTRDINPSKDIYQKAFNDIKRSGLCPKYLMSIDQSVVLSKVPTVTSEDIEGVIQTKTVTTSKTKSITTTHTDSDIDSTSSSTSMTTVTTVSTVEFTLNEDYNIPYEYDFYEHCGKIKILKNLKPEMIGEALCGRWYLYSGTPCMFDESDDSKIGLFNTAFPACSMQLIIDSSNDGLWNYETPTMMLDGGINAITGEISKTRSMIRTAFDGNCPFGAFIIDTEGYYKDVFPKVNTITPEGIIMQSPGKLYRDSYMACIAGYQPGDFLLIAIADKYKNLFFDDDVNLFYVLTRQRIVPQNVIKAINQELCRCGYSSKYLISFDQTVDLTDKFIFDRSYFEYSCSRTTTVISTTVSTSSSDSVNTSCDC